MICSNIGLNLPRSSVYFVLLTRVSIVTRDIDMANLSVRLSVRPSVRLSVTFRYSMETA